MAILGLAILLVKIYCRGITHRSAHRDLRQVELSRCFSSPLPCAQGQPLHWSSHHPPLRPLTSSTPLPSASRFTGSCATDAHFQITKSNSKHLASLGARRNCVVRAPDNLKSSLHIARSNSDAGGLWLPLDPFSPPPEKADIGKVSTVR
ncbi:hypothetical protein EDB92DRAFT_1057083 [Lactarius akahatsu]|uniref:Uncharacterized protein n=1 Tax=Lactarius akahatsu TaxID=416441 RepID=A0AAD4QBZ3_9AGAM|nr:hypothetical protein EDB92DRAFT_1057083 [Lactarius akahatsu]